MKQIMLQVKVILININNIYFYVEILHFLIELLMYLNYKPIDEIRKNFLKNNINRKKFCAAVISDINPIFSNK